MSDYRFPQQGTNGYVSPYSDIDYSKGPKVIYGDTDVLRIIFNDPQTDEDDEWGRTEHIALRQLTDEAITVRKALFGWSSVSGLLDKWDYFETNHMQLDYVTSANSILTIGNTTLINGQLQLLAGTKFTASELTMNSEYWKMFKVGTYGMKAQAGDNNGGAGDVTAYWAPGDPDGNAFFQIIVNNVNYTFTSSAFSLPAGVSFSAGSSSFTSITVGDLTVANSLMVTTVTSDTLYFQSTGTTTLLTLEESGIVASAVFSNLDSFSVFSDTVLFQPKSSLGDPQFKIDFGVDEIKATWDSGSEEGYIVKTSGYAWTWYGCSTLSIQRDSSWGSVTFGTAGSISLKGTVVNDTVQEYISLVIGDVDSASDPFGLIFSKANGTAAAKEGIVLKDIPLFVYDTTLSKYSSLTYNTLTLDGASLVGSNAAGTYFLNVVTTDFIIKDQSSVAYASFNGGPKSVSFDKWASYTYATPEGPNELLLWNSSNIAIKGAKATSTINAFIGGTEAAYIGASGIATEKEHYIKWTHFDMSNAFTTGGSFPSTHVINVPSVNQISAANKILSISVVLFVSGGVQVYTAGWSAVSYNSGTNTMSITIPADTGISISTAFDMRVLIKYVA